MSTDGCDIMVHAYRERNWNRLYLHTTDLGTKRNRIRILRNIKWSCEFYFRKIARMKQRKCDNCNEEMKCSNSKDIEKGVRKEKDLQGKWKDCVIYVRIGKEL